jgi:beta-hydroxylase
MRYGRKLLIALQRWIARASLIGDTPFFTREQFAWAGELEAQWQTIRRELDHVLEFRDELPDFSELSPDQKHLAAENQWKTFPFFAYGLRADGNCARCPETTRILERIPGIKTAFFSILSPRMHIPAHCGPWKGVIRCHLGLLVPEPAAQCRIRVADQIATWSEGAAMFFDDTFEHEVWNGTDGMRVVLFMDVLRPMRWPVSALNKFVIKMIAASPFIKDASRNYTSWEQRFEKIWQA